MKHMNKLLQVLFGAGLFALFLTLPSCKKNLKAGDGSGGASTVPRSPDGVADADSAMACDRATAQAWEQFRWINNPDGTISLQGTNGMYVPSNNGVGWMTCDRAQAQALDWSIAGNSANQGPNIYSELKWRNAGGIFARADVQWTL